MILSMWSTLAVTTFTFASKPGWACSPFWPLNPCNPISPFGPCGPAIPCNPLGPPNPNLNRSCSKICMFTETGSPCVRIDVLTSHWTAISAFYRAALGLIVCNRIECHQSREMFAHLLFFLDYNCVPCIETKISGWKAMAGETWPKLTWAATVLFSHCTHHVRPKVESLPS